MRADLPAGAVTFLFTDVEGSTRLLHRLGEAAYADVLAEHRRVLRGAFGRHGGAEVDTQGDAFFFAFSTPGGALEAAEEGCRALGSGPVRVRVGVHTGTPVLTAEGYVGVDVHRAARIAAAGSGGQILVSSSTAQQIDPERFSLRDLGDHRFKDLLAPERLYQLGDSAFPPLRSLYRANLPVPATAFVGRDDEVNEVAALLRRDTVALLTLTGPGGTGKTRLALQAAAESTEAFPDGTWWVPLAALSDRDLVLPRIAEAMDIAEEAEEPLVDVLARRLGGRRMLILLDNAEHLLPEIATLLAALLAKAAGPTFLVTSRERLQVAVEHEYPVLGMEPDDAAALFMARAVAAGVAPPSEGDVQVLCDRLDRLPLALQLAAPRLKLFSIDQLLERLSSRLDLLKGGHDADPRQATLRATIDWSYGLLTHDERILFDRLSVFVGGCTVAAAETVAEADADILQGLLHKNMLQRRTDDDGRLWMLSAIQEFAAERLDARGEADMIRRAHGAWCRALAERADAEIQAGEPEERAVAAIDAEIDNIRAAVDFGVATSDVDLVRRITVALPMYWTMRDRYTEARAWLDRALASSPIQDETRLRLLSALASVAYRQGDHVTAIRASDERAELAMRLGGVTDRFQDLKLRAGRALETGELDEAEKLYRLAMDAAIEVDNGVGISSCRLNLSTLANEEGHYERADAILHENLPFVRSRGQSRCEAFTLMGLAETAALRGELDESAGWATSGAGRACEFGERSLAAYCLDLAAGALAAQGASEAAATILAATESARQQLAIELDEEETAARDRAFNAIQPTLDDIELDSALSRGREMELGEAVDLALGARERARP